MIPISDNTRRFLRPDSLALARFLRPYATDSRLRRIAEQDVPGADQYFTDYRAYFDTFAPAPGREWVDDEAARYTHYDVRCERAALPREDAIHVALSGALAVWRGSWSGWEFISLGSVLWALDGFPEIREPLMRTAFHYAISAADAQATETPFHFAVGLVAGAGFEEFAMNEAVVLELCCVLSLMEAEGALLGMGSKLQSHRWLHRLNNYVGAEDVALWTAIANRELPGPFSAGPARIALLALRARLNGDNLLPHSVSPNLDARQPRLFSDSTREELSPSEVAVAPLLFDLISGNDLGAAPAEFLGEALAAYCLSGHVNPDADHDCRHLVYCFLCGVTPFLRTELVGTREVLIAASHSILRALEPESVFSDGLKSDVLALALAAPHVPGAMAPSVALLSRLAERYPYPAVVYGEFRDRERVFGDSMQAHTLAALVILAAAADSPLLNDATLLELTCLLSEAESSLARSQVRYEMEPAARLPWLHRCTYFSGSESCEVRSWRTLAKSIRPERFDSGALRSRMLRLRALLEELTPVPLDFALASE